MNHPMISNFSSALLAAGALVLVTLVPAMSVAGEATGLNDQVVVYKSPSCGCCGKWVTHMEQAGFVVETRDRRDLKPIKSMAGVPGGLRSCHTAMVNGYVIEGHVPAQDVQRLLAEKPDIKGLAVPGMPMGSPGMEGPRKDRYSVMAIGKDGSNQVFSRH